MEKVEKVAQLCLNRYYGIDAIDHWAVLRQLRQLVVDNIATFIYYSGDAWDYEKDKDFKNPESTCTYHECMTVELSKVDGDLATFRVSVRDGDLSFGRPTNSLRRKFDVVAPLRLCTHMHGAIQRRFDCLVTKVYEERQEEVLRKKLQKISQEILKSL